MADSTPESSPDSFGRTGADVDDDESGRAQRAYWDGEADDYYAEHGAFLRDDQLVWGPEGVTEDDLGLLGDLIGRDVLEFGAGAAQGARWAAGRGARVVASDISLGMLRVGARLDRDTGAAIPAVQADALSLPFADGSFEIAFSAYGAVPFIADSTTLMRELARVLRPGGRLVFSTSHPVRWSFPDVPGEAGLVAEHSYFDRAPYVERTGGVVTYVEHHRTLGDRIRDLVAAGFELVNVVEPEWPAWNEETWGGWSPLRGALLPGTAIFVARRT